MALTAYSKDYGRISLWPFYLEPNDFKVRLFFYLQMGWVSRRGVLFGERSLVPAFVVQSLSIDHRSAPIKINYLLPSLIK